MRGLDRLTVAVVAAVVASHVAFVALDGRLPRDLNLAYTDLVPAWVGLHGDVPASTFLAVPLRPGGWYVAALAGWMSVVGRSAASFRAVDVALVAWIVGGSAWVARRHGGPAAGLATAALLGVTPAIASLGRLGWIHTPEAALAVGALVVATADPALDRRGTRVGLGVLAGLAIALRPSALILFGPLALTWPRRRWLAPGIGALLGLAVQAPTLTTYFGYKLGARGRYAAFLPGLAEQAGTLIGPIVAVGLLVGIVAWARGGRPGPWRLLLGGWVALPLVVHAASSAGLDNFPIIGVGLAIVAGLGYGAARPAWLAVPLVGFAALNGATWVRAEPPPVAHALGVELRPVQPDGVPFLPGEGFGAREADALLAATCGARVDVLGQCVIVVDQGWFFPYTEEPGWLELVLMGHEAVSLQSLRSRIDVEHTTPDALVGYDCGDEDRQWRERFPDSAALFATLARRNDLREVWRRPGPRCTLWWATPGGRLAAPDALPDRLAVPVPVKIPAAPRGPGPRGR